jgi:hypothetical protein
MTLDQLLVLVCKILERQGIPYLVTGSIATIAYGEPRFTNDIDIAVRLAADQVEALVAAFPSPEFYVATGAAHDAAVSGGQFNIIHPESGLKVDIMVATASAFNSSRFARGRVLRIATGESVTFAAPEDVIIKKLQYFQEGGGEKHLRDIGGVLTTSPELIDRSYLRQWTVELGVEDIWGRFEGAEPPF